MLVAKHLFQHRYDYRGEWLRFTRTISSGGSSASIEERVIRAVADITDPAERLRRFAQLHLGMLGRVPEIARELVGLPVDGVEMKLVPTGEKLEARFRGPSVTPGYWRQPELTRPFRVPLNFGRLPLLPPLAIASIVVLLASFEAQVYALGAAILAAIATTKIGASRLDGPLGRL